MTIKHFFKILYKYWMKFAHVLGTINGFILLFIFYFILLGVYSIPYHIYRFVRYGLRPPQAASFWKKKEKTALDKDSISYQF